MAPNVLKRNFEATAPNQKWLADMTYVATDEGWLYVALVLDCPMQQRHRDERQRERRDPQPRPPVLARL